MPLKLYSMVTKMFKHPLFIPYSILVRYNALWYETVQLVSSCPLQIQLVIRICIFMAVRNLASSSLFRLSFLMINPCCVCIYCGNEFYIVMHCVLLTIPCIINAKYEFLPYILINYSKFLGSGLMQISRWACFIMKLLLLAI